jgi:hypothetical protein
MPAPSTETISLVFRLPGAAFVLGKAPGWLKPSMVVKGSVMTYSWAARMVTVPTAEGILKVIRSGAPLPLARVMQAPRLPGQQVSGGAGHHAIGRSRVGEGDQADE